MATTLGNVSDGTAYPVPGVSGVTPIKPIGKSSESAPQLGNIKFKNTSKSLEIAANGKEAAKEDGKNVSGEGLKEAAEELSKVVQSMGADLTFSVHEATHRLMVRMVDPTTGVILREYPSTEFLDMVARIRDYVGNLLDKKV